MRLPLQCDGSWERAEAASTGGVGRAPARASDARLMDAKLLEFFGPCSPVHRACGSSPVGYDAFCLPPECCSGPSPLLPDAFEDNVVSLEGLRNPISDDVEGFGLAELFVEAPIALSLEHSTLEASVFDHDDGVDEPLEEIPVASILVPSTAATEDIQVEPRDPIADKRNAFLSLVFCPVPPPTLATSAPRRDCAPKEVATTPRRSGRIEKQKQKRKDVTTQELLARAWGLLEEKAEFDGNALAAFIDKFKTPLSPRSITMLGSLVNNMEKVKMPKGRKVGTKKEIT